MLAYVQAFLKQGLTAEKLALCIALGCAIGIIPMLGTTTVLCALAGWLFSLNQPAIQSVNYLVYPLQLALLIPWYRLGEHLFGVRTLGPSVSDVKALLAQGIPRAVSALWSITIHAVAAWCLAAPGMIALLYVVLRPVFRKLAQKNLIAS